MEKLYLEIMKLLKEDARYSASQIATMLGEEVEAVKLAIDNMETNGIIVKYTAIIDEEKLSEDMVEALIEVKVAPQKMRGFDAIAEEIYQYSEVKSLYLMSGAYDLAVFVEGKSLKDVARFVSEKLSVKDSILSTATHFILKKYKIEGEITQKENLDNTRLIVHP